MIRRAGAIAALATLLGCGGGGGSGNGGAAGVGTGGVGGTIGVGGAGGTTAIHRQQSHSSALVVSPDQTRLYVAHPDADSVSVLDAGKRTILHEISLAATPPTVDGNNRYEPAVGPRALALDSTGATLFVTGQRSGTLYALDASSGAVKAHAFVCAEPIGVLVSADDTRVFVACSQDDEIVEVAATDLSPIATAVCPRKPWGLAWMGDGQTLLATHLLGPGVSRFATAPLALATIWPVADGPPIIDPVSNQEDPTEPHGAVRGLYDAVARPGTSEVWVAHLMLGIDTPQPDLDFQETVFPSLSILDSAAGGNQLARLTVLANPGDGGAFGDIVSGPRALTFSDDGKLAFIADTDSEDILIVDAERRIETQIIRPLPGHLPEALAYANGELYVQERNTEDLAIFRVTGSGASLSIAADGPSVPTLSADPMPANLRLGQLLFYSANSDQFPLTSNHWVACATCHLEGRSDAVTWDFAQGPRDTPTNAGGLLDTGFLFRTADRTQVQDYWRTINIEQGGHFGLTDPTQKSQLDALAAYVNYAIPTPIPPTTDEAHAQQGQALAAVRTQGATVFGQLGCATCHSGPAKTDSGAGNPSLDLTGPVVSTTTTGGVLLHNVGTCVTTGDFPDVEHDDIDGDDRDGCSFDTPALRGLTDSAPYLHDGSAPTLEAAVTAMLAPAATATGATTPPSATDLHALIEYLRSL
ncbi:MAG TPA: beta-propeller fold lactonase family protein [Polyangia bacterium]|nr:beta-propeller fold lactonase family protein [Polyangia bacterium]